MTTHIAFVSPPELRRDSEQLIANIEARARDSQADLMTRIITRFTDEVLKVFFIDTIQLMNLSPFLSRIVMGSVNTIKNTVSSVSRTIIHKLDNKQLAPMSSYMGSVMLTATDAAGAEHPYVGFPLSERARARLEKLVHDIRSGNPREHVQELVDTMIEINDLAVNAYLQQPVELLRLGLILRKLAEGGIAVIRGAVHMVIRRLAPDLTPEQMLAVVNHLDSLRLEGAHTYR